MKKGLVTCLAVIIAAASFAQDGDSKKVQMGIGYQFGLNLYKPGTKNFAKNGAGVQNSIGLNVNFNFNENIGLATGVEFDFESIRMKLADNVKAYYYFTDTDIQKKEDYTTGQSLYNLTERKYKNIYVTIPTMLTFRTNAIGDFRYYGKFGLRTSFLLKSQSDDEGFTFASNNFTDTPVASDNKGMRTPYANDIFIIRSSVGLAGGAQWNFTGSTVLFAELGFYYGFTPVHNTGDNVDKMTLFTSGVNNGTGNDAFFRPKGNLSQLCLKIGILF
jgi:hypothetical protein